MIDTHSHVWELNPEKYPWQPIGGYIPKIARPVEELLQLMDLNGIEHTVLVQPTPYGWDNSYLLDAIQKNPRRFKAVCLVDPHSTESPKNLIYLVTMFGVNGVRFNWNLEPNFPWAEDQVHNQIWEAVINLGISICVQLIESQLFQVNMMAERFPQLKIVLDHLGRPKTGSKSTDLGFQQLLDLSHKDNCYVKLSGLYYFSLQKAPYEDTWPLLREVIHKFGANRCVWGSDFPFVLENWSYSEWLTTLIKWIDPNHSDLDWILEKTALVLGW